LSSWWPSLSTSSATHRLSRAPRLRRASGRATSRRPLLEADEESDVDPLYSDVGGDGSDLDSDEEAALVAELEEEEEGEEEEEW